MTCDVYREALPRQLAEDFCVTYEDVLSEKNCFSLYTPRPGRRRFQEKEETLLKIASVYGKLLFCGREEILRVMRSSFENTPGNWFFEYSNIRKLEELLLPFGLRVEKVRPFYLPDPRARDLTGGPGIRVFEKDELERFRGDSRFSDAFAFDPLAPDMLGVAALQDERIVGMAGASADSPLFWQIGINVLSEYRSAGIASYLVWRLREQILSRGAVPFYSTGVSHILSQRVAARAGFLPAWAELSTCSLTAPYAHEQAPASGPEK